MRQALLTIAALLIAAAILLAGNGLQNTLLAVRGNLEGFSLTAIGLLLSSFFVGFIAGCKLTPVFVKNVGHIRTFTALASVASAAALGHALFVDPIWWMALRVITGLCIAGLNMIIESWINERAPSEKRGRILAVYRMVDFSALLVGQALLTLADPLGFALFAVVSILISLALVPVALSTAVAPQPIKGAQLNIRKLWTISPVAAAGTLSCGAANGAFWALGPVFIQQVGYEIGAVATFMSAVILGGAMGQWPLGVISDLVDRRRVIAGIAFGAVIASAVIVVYGTVSLWTLLPAAVAFGAMSMPIFAISAALAHDRAEPGEYVETSGGLLLLYGVGAMIGPLVGAIVMDWAGAQALFVFAGSVYVIYGGFSLMEIRRRPPVPFEDKAAYVGVPRTTPTVFELAPQEEEDTAYDASTLPDGVPRG
ncbi:MFS transporter [Abyssibacter sp.]|uniref:MFS transporter n=1 Tax=Abyssibacter sp. TaxID=2320200 RepID=UPI0025B9BDF1|nr:MFS transporter [Abyssibacter sp.]MCK5860035.1 MFS transporter [Abyssibacter sp.]